MSTDNSQPPTLLESCDPRDDVLLGEIPESQFAASLDDVAHGDDAPHVYENPTEFFDKTYPTNGLQELLTHLTTRFVSDYKKSGYSGTNGIVRLDTSFGGGKTHNEIAAYHLAESPGRINNIESYLNDESLADEYLSSVATGLSVNTAVFVGGAIDGQNARCDFTDPNAPNTNTIWGEMAYQLFGQDGYEELREYDEARTPPGTKKLTQLFNSYEAPSLIILDEIAAYLEQASGVEHAADDDTAGGLEIASEAQVGGTTLAQQTNAFLMSLLAATENTDKVTVVLSIADTAFEGKAYEVREILTELANDFNNIADRTEQSITPTEDHEIAAVLRYRLFESVDTDARDSVVETYLKFYEDHHVEFPDFNESANTGENSDASHEERLKEAYPFHPTTIDTLTQELDSLPAFHRTRGALKLLSHAISDLWNQTSPVNSEDRHFIRLFDLHPSNEGVRSTLLRLYESTGVDFDAPVKADIYSNTGTAHAQHEDKRWSDAPVGTQLTTTILWKSLVEDSSGRGTTGPPIWYAVTNCNIDMSHYTDALESLIGDGGSDNSTCHYLHRERNGGSRYLFKVKPKLIKLVDEVELDDGIIRQQTLEALEDAVGSNSVFNVVMTPETVHEIPDEPTTPNLCVMDFDTVSITTQEGDVPDLLTEMQTYTATTAGGQQSMRSFKNNVLFLVANENDIRHAWNAAETVASIKYVLRNYESDYDLDSKNKSELEDMLGGKKGDLGENIKKAYSNLFYPGEDGLESISLTVDGYLHTAVTDFLSSSNTLVKDGDGPFGVQWFERHAWMSNADSMTTEELQHQFGKRPGADILLSPTPLRTTIRKVVAEDGYAYWNADTQTGYYTDGAAVADEDTDITTAKNLSDSIPVSAVHISDTHHVFKSVTDLVNSPEVAIEWDPEWECEACGEVFDDESVFTEHTCTTRTCETCSQSFNTDNGYEAHLPCDSGPVRETTTVQLHEQKHVETAANDLKSDIERWIETVVTEENLSQDEYGTTVNRVQIQINDADGWKSTWFTANKLNSEDAFGDNISMDFEYIATPDLNSGTEFTVEYTGTPADFKQHCKFNMEPEELIRDGGERICESVFEIERPPERDAETFDPHTVLDTLVETLAVENGFTITLSADIEVATNLRGDQ